MRETIPPYIDPELTQQIDEPVDEPGAPVVDPYSQPSEGVAGEQGEQVQDPPPRRRWESREAFEDRMRDWERQHAPPESPRETHGGSAGMIAVTGLLAAARGQAAARARHRG